MEVCKRKVEAHWSQQKRISDHNTEKTPILWPQWQLPDEGRTNVESHSVWCDGGQLHRKGDHVENGHMISRIGARRTCTHWDGRQPTGLSGRGLLDMQSTPTGDLAHAVKQEEGRSDAPLWATDWRRHSRYSWYVTTVVYYGDSIANLSLQTR